MPRRDLLKETLSAFGKSSFSFADRPYADSLVIHAVKSKTLVKLGQDWQAELRRIAAVERED